jgi:hypothetical protein
MMGVAVVVMAMVMVGEQPAEHLADAAKGAHRAHAAAAERASRASRGKAAATAANRLQGVDVECHFSSGPRSRPHHAGRRRKGTAGGG